MRLFEILEILSNEQMALQLIERAPSVEMEFRLIHIVITTEPFSIMITTEPFSDISWNG